MPPVFDLNQRGCELTVMNAETYHTAQSECVYVRVILTIPVINKAFFECGGCLTVIQIDTNTETCTQVRV